jgi:hypothetical protein
MPTTDPSAPPSRELLFLEIRAFWEMSAFFTTYPLLRLAPRGDGPPGARAAGSGGERHLDPAAAPLLEGPGLCGAWMEARREPRPRPGAEAKMQERLAELHARHGKKVSLIGWSLGGVFAREDGAARARSRAQRDHARQSVRRRAKGEQRLEAL